MFRLLFMESNMTREEFNYFFNQDETTGPKSEDLETDVEEEYEEDFEEDELEDEDEEEDDDLDKATGIPD